MTKIIALEGVGGSGKTTLAAALTAHLTSIGHPTQTIKRPSRCHVAGGGQAQDTTRCEDVPSLAPLARTPPVSSWWWGFRYGWPFRGRWVDASLRCPQFRLQSMNYKRTEWVDDMGRDCWKVQALGISYHGIHFAGVCKSPHCASIRSRNKRERKRPCAGWRTHLGPHPKLHPPAPVPTAPLPRVILPRDHSDPVFPCPPFDRCPGDPLDFRRLLLSAGGFQDGDSWSRSDHRNCRSLQRIRKIMRWRGNLCHGKGPRGERVHYFSNYFGTPTTRCAYTFRAEHPKCTDASNGNTL